MIIYVALYHYTDNWYHMVICYFIPLLNYHIIKIIIFDKGLVDVPHIIFESFRTHGPILFFCYASHVSVYSVCIYQQGYLSLISMPAVSQGLGRIE